MGVGITAFTRHKYNGFPSKEERLSFLRKTAKQVATFYDLDEDAISEEVEIEEDSFAFYVDEIGITFNLMRDCWEIEMCYRYHSYFDYCDNKSWLREFVFDAVRSLGGREAWIATEYDSLYFSGNPNDILDDHLAELMEENSMSVIPKITYSVIEGINKGSEYESLYYDSFDECWDKLDALNKRYSLFGNNVSIKVLQPQVSPLFRIVLIDGKKYLFNDNSLNKFVSFPINKVKNLSSVAFTITADGMSYLYAPDGHLLHKKRDGVYLTRPLKDGELFLKSDDPFAYSRYIVIYEKTSNWTLYSYWSYREKDGQEEQFFWYHRNRKAIFTRVSWLELYYDCVYSDNQYKRYTF